jgi:cephalosporin-C deacetylase
LDFETVSKQGQGFIMNHSFPFDPTYGYDEAALRSIGCPSEPADFEAFWRQTYAMAKRVPPNPTRRVIRESRRMKIYEVEFDAWNGDQPIRIGGWMTTPGDEKITTGLVVGHGYGGRGGPELSPLIPSAAVIYPCARGFNRSADASIPNVAGAHVLHGIESRETYVHRGCVIDLWAAAWALMELEPASIDWMCCAGESFGGGIGALAIPWEPAFKRAFLDYPSFGNHPLRLQMQCVGSGESVRQTGGESHLPVLQYFDAATAAAHTKIPVMVAAALFDPAVPPPGQFAVYNCLAGEKKLFVRQAAHFDWAGSAEEDRAVKQAAAAWLARVV